MSNEIVRHPACSSGHRRLLVLGSCLLFAGCGSPTASGPRLLEPTQLCSAGRNFDVGTFGDGKLEAGIRAALAIGAEEDLTCGLLAGLTELFLSGDTIEDLSGTQNLISLSDLQLDDNSITEIGPLSGLTMLTTLDLSENSIADISALSGLSSLTFLNLSENSIADVSALSGLANLTTLFIDANLITDVSALNGLTSLTTMNLNDNLITEIDALSGITGLAVLDLRGNSITDITALSGLIDLRNLSLHRNADLTDIQPLLDNPGIGAGDTVRLMDTNVSCADVAALEAKGVFVFSDCP